MPLVTTCFGTFYSNSSGDVTITCANLMTTLDSLAALADSLCGNPEQVYEMGVTGTTSVPYAVNIPGGDLPTTRPQKIRVYLNGLREFDTALSGGATGYTVTDASTITFTDDLDDTTYDILVEYDI